MANNNKNGVRNAVTLGIINALAGTYATSAIAQAAVPQEITVVSGFRNSVIKAKDLKRREVIAQDSIVAEDIADFPDLNLADSLQRVPGVAITREGGEGRQISLRGMGPDFTRVEINGMEALGTSSSPMDSRGAVGRSRAFDFNIFASELFNQIDVKKSYSADQEEGGIGGTVGLHTARPFDSNGFQSLIGGQGGTNSNTDNFDKRIVGLISNTWGYFGALASVAYSTKESREYGYNTYRWRPKNTSDYSDSLDADTVALLDVPPEDATLWFSRGNRYSVWNNEQERLGMTVSLQYQPSNNIDLSLDYLRGSLENALNEHHISTGGSSSTALGRVEELAYLDNNGDKEVLFGRYSNATIRTEAREDYNESVFDQFTLNGVWRLSYNLEMVAQVGTSTADYNQPKVNKANLMRENSGITTDFTQDRFYGVNTYDFDTTLAEGWEVKDLYFQEDYITTDYDNAKIDFEYALGHSGTLTFGANYKQFSNSGERRSDSGYVESVATPLNNGIINQLADITNVYSEHPDQRWLELDVDAVHAFYGLDGLVLGEDKIQPTSAYEVQEETQALYAQYGWESMIGDAVFRGSVGLRYYDTELTSNGISGGEPKEVVRDYSGVLPTLNLVYEFNDVLFRFGASKNLTRPSLADLSVSASVAQSTISEGDTGKVNVGNPELKPYSSVDINAAIESYFDGVGFFSAAVFYKDIKDFIVTETDSETYTLSELVLPESLLPIGGTPVTQAFLLTRPQNADASTIKGFELSFQRDLDFLPAPFDNTGVIANYTWADGTSQYRNVQGSGEDQVKPFQGLSRSSYNLTVYYETETWGARIATAYRDSYISRVEAGLGDEDERGFHDTRYIDFSAFYQLTESLKFNFEGINLSNQREEQYSDSSDRQYNTTTSGRTFMVGVTYKF